MITTGTAITVDPGQSVSIRANAPRATGYKWDLVGDGKISTTSRAPAAIYTAPDKGGGLAILSVTAYNEQGDSPITTVTINIRGTTSVRLEALGIPAGWMSGQAPPKNYLSIGPSTIACHTGKDCKQYTYKSGGNWAGIMWWPLTCGKSGTPDAWKKVQDGTCGVNVPKAGNLQTVKRLSFWARGQRGGEVVEFKVGAADVLPSPGRSLGEITLGPAWKRYTIDLAGVDLTNSIGLFSWVATDVSNPQGAVFYLDEIQFEGAQ